MEIGRGVKKWREEEEEERKKRRLLVRVFLKIDPFTLGHAESTRLSIKKKKITSSIKKYTLHTIIKNEEYIAQF